MKKIVLSTTIVVILMGFKSLQEKEVFICKSVASHRYHLKETCKGLSKCNAIIKKTTKIKAEKVGRTLCRWED